jgi:hypothetical protein
MPKTRSIQPGKILPILAVITLLAIGSIAQAAHAVSSGSPLTSPSPQTFGNFGTSMAIDGSTVVVGAPGETVGTAADAGRAYVFNATTGELINSLISPNSQFDGGFGTSVAISDTTVVVGAPYEAAGTTADAGQVYVFDAASGVVIRALVSPNAQASGEFGLSVGVYVDDATVVVGAPGEPVSTTLGAGHAYIFDVASGSVINTLTSLNPEFDGGFGTSVAISGTIVAVGAPYETVGIAANAGHAYVFDAPTGSLISTLVSPNAQALAEFGDSVSVGDTTVAVGAPSESAGITVQAGHVYVFDAASGGVVNTLTSPSPQAFGRFGWSVGVSIDDSTVIVGAYSESEGTALHAGHAYIFS